MIRGAYQFWRASDDQNQLADIVINAVGRLGPGDLPVMLDIEGASMQGESAAFIQQQMDLWLSKVEQGTGKKPLIYTGKYAWDPSVQSPAYGGYPLWIAAYGANSGGVPTSCPNTPMGWSTWSFWQYTSIGAIPGIGTNVDKSLFNGDLAALQSLANGLTDDDCLGTEAQACGSYGCGCVDHACSGGAKCPGSGSTARNALDCGNYGCHSVDGTCSGGFCPGSGCTAKETADCAAQGAGCVDEKCSGGTASGTGCTARQALDCQGLDAGCELGACVTASGPVVVDAGRPLPAPDDGGLVPVADAGTAAPTGSTAPQVTSPPEPVDPVRGGCSAAPGSLAVAALALLVRRRAGR